MTAARLGDTMSWPSRDEAIATRDRVADALDASADRLGALGLDATWRSIVDLRAAWVRGVTAAAAPLPRVISVTPAMPISTLALAYQLDGDNLANLVDRAGDIARRNAVSHPGFLAPGAALEVLADE
jgi:prophage DNA circulation protein